MATSENGSHFFSFDCITQKASPLQKPNKQNQKVSCAAILRLSQFFGCLKGSIASAGTNNT